MSIYKGILASAGQVCMRMNGIRHQTGLSQDAWLPSTSQVPWQKWCLQIVTELLPRGILSYLTGMSDYFRENFYTSVFFSQFQVSRKGKRNKKQKRRWQILLLWFCKCVLSSQAKLGILKSTLLFCFCETPALKLRTSTSSWDLQSYYIALHFYPFHSSVNEF